MKKLTKVRKKLCDASYMAFHIAVRVAVVAFAVNTACGDFGGGKK